MNYNKSQQQAIRHKDGPMLVLAGPGSGKTAVITQRTKQLIEYENIDPSNILVITFTRAAAQEMKQRFLAATGEERTKVTFGTFHAIFFMVLKLAYHFDSGNIISEEQRYQFMREILSYHHLEYRDEGEFIGDVLTEISRVKNEQIPLEHFYSSSCGEEVFRKIYREYDERLKRNRLIDFDDMLLLCRDLFIKRPDILKKWQEKFRYILIDEFQDINRVQYEIVRMLAAPGNNLFIVGDDDQSIYRFRGAKPEIMLGFEKDYPQAKRTLLGINYRSTSNIVDDAGKLIRHNKTRFDKEIRAARGAGKPVLTSGFADAQAETRMIVKEIQDYVQMGYPYSDIAVLYRTNMEPRLLMERLMEYNIPFQMRDALPNIYEHWITQDLLTYIRMAADPLAEQHQAKRADALRIINRPKRYISREALDGAVISWDSVKSWYRAKDWMVERIEDLEYDLKILKKLAPVAAVNYIRKAIGYDEYLKDYAEYRRMKPEELFELADQIQESASGYKTMEAWLLHMEEYGEQLKQQAQNLGERDLNCVALMTMHSSKGLEFPVVYIMDANERVTPHHKAVLVADLEEERRMFYVAMTRAKDRLHVYYTKERYGKPQERSRFIDEYLYPDGAPPGEFRPGPQQNGAAGSYNRKAVR